jgi:hypothetical protein
MRNSSFKIIEHNHATILIHDNSIANVANNRVPHHKLGLSSTPKLKKYPKPQIMVTYNFFHCGIKDNTYYDTSS